MIPAAVQGSHPTCTRSTVSSGLCRQTQAYDAYPAVDRIHEFQDKDSTFPSFYRDKDIYFGSFARKTKKRELDGIDIMICLSGQGGWYQEYSDRIEITVPDDPTILLNSKPGRYTHCCIL